MVKGKKGQMQELSGIAVALVAIGILLVIGFLILGEVKTQVVDLATTLSITNGTIAFTNNSFTTLNGSCANDATATVSAVYNSTTGVGATTALIASGNYTVSGNRINLSVDGFAGNVGGVMASNVWVSYNCQEASYALNGTKVTQGAMDDIPGWLAIIVITIIGAVLIGLIAMFRGR